MSRTWRVKTFKSGNSMAMRLPKALGFTDGDDVTIVGHRDGSFSLWKVDDARAAFMALSGSMSAGFMAAGREQGTQSDRDWSAGARSVEAA